MKVRSLTFMLFIVSPGLYAQSDTYSVEFNSAGRISAVNSREFLRGNRQEQLHFDVRIALNDGLLQEHYKTYFARHVALIDYLNLRANRDTLESFYGFTKREIDEQLKKSRCLIQTAPAALKETLGYPGLTFGERGCVVDYHFRPYTFEISAVPASSGKDWDLKSAGYTDNTMAYSFTGKFDRYLRSINYRLKFEKPEAVEFNKALPSITSAKDMAGYEKADSTARIGREILKRLNVLWPRATQPRGFTNPNVRAAMVRQMRGYADSLTVCNMLLSGYFYSQKPIVSGFLWYTGRPLLNPISKKDLEKRAPALARTIAKSRQDSLRFAGLIAMYQASHDYYKDLVKTSLKEKATLAEVDNVVLKKSEALARLSIRYQASRDSVSYKLDSLRRLRLRLLKEEKEQDHKVAEFRVKDIYLYNGVIFPGTASATNRVSFRSYSRETSKELKPLNILPTSYDQTENVYILVENETSPNSFSWSIKQIPDVAPAVGEITPALDQLGGVVSTIAKASIGPSDRNLSRVLQEIRIAAMRLTYFSSKLAPPPEMPTAFVADDSADYFTSYTEAEFPDTTKSSYIYTQYIKNPKANRTDSVKFRVNKLYRVLPFAGLAYSFAENPEVRLNDDGTVKEVNYFDGTAVIMGLKFYPFGATPIYDSKFIISRKRRPHIDYRKLNVCLGVGVKQPLKQFYLGLGVDFWSGVSISGGLHAIDKAQEKLVEGKLDTQKYLDWNNGYISVNLDVSLAIKLINLLVK